jgi:hypothetical protein
MKAFQKAEALAGRHYDRDKLLSLVHWVTTHFRMPNSFERSRMRTVCRYLADALDRCSGSTLQHRWTISRRGFGRSVSLPSIVAQYILDLGCTRPDLCADDRSESGHVVRPAR